MSCYLCGRMNKTDTRSSIKAISLACLSLLFLAVYLIGSIQVDSIHHLVHPDDHVILHSPEQEKDTCHQSIYHAGLNHGCEHKSHLSEFKKCTLCDYANHSVHLFSIHAVNLPNTLNNSAEEYYILSETKATLFYSSSRAPPTA